MLLNLSNPIEYWKQYKKHCDKFICNVIKCIIKKVKGLFFFCFLFIQICCLLFANETNKINDYYSIASYVNIYNPQNVSNTIPLMYTDNKSSDYNFESINKIISREFIYSFLFIIFCLILISYFIRQKTNKFWLLDGKIWGIMPINSKVQLYLVELYGKFVILGVSEYAVSVVLEITDKEIIDKIKLDRSINSANSILSFYKFFNKTFSNLNKSHNTISNNEANITTNSNQTINTINMEALSFVEKENNREEKGNNFDFDANSILDLNEINQRVQTNISKANEYRDKVSKLLVKIKDGR